MAVDDRLAEANAVRKELAYLMPKLISAAKNYVGVDLQNSIDIDKYTDPHTD